MAHSTVKRATALPIAQTSSGRRARKPRVERAIINRAIERAKRKFLRAFPGGFRDETYLDWERDYKWESHERWEEVLGLEAFSALLRARRFEEIAAAALRVEQRSHHPMLFSFEKM